jgi:hypothetical protein
MNEPLDNGRGFLKEKLGGYVVSPPDSVWGFISVRLGRRRSRGMTLMLLAAAASVALAVTLGINYFSPSRDQEEALALKQDGTVAPDPVAGEQNVPRHKEALEDRVVRTLEAVVAETEEKSSTSPFQRPGEKEIASVNEEAATVSDPGHAEIESLVATDGTSTEQIAPGSEVETGEKAALATSPDAGNQSEAELASELWEEPDRDPRWVLGAAMSPLYTFRDAQPQPASQEYESGVIAYAGGIQVGFRTSRRLAIESGIFFNKMGIDIGAPGILQSDKEYDFSPLGEETGRSNIMAVSNSVGNIVSISGDIYVNSYKLNAIHQTDAIADAFSDAVNAGEGIRQHLDYLEVPLNLRYTLVDRSIKLQLVGGMSTNLLVNNYVTMEGDGGSKEIGYLTNVRNVNYSGNAGIGLVYHFLDNLSLSIEPRFRYFLNSVNDGTLPATRPYTLGLYTGLNYQF